MRHLASKSGLAPRRSLVRERTRFEPGGPVGHGGRGVEGSLGGAELEPGGPLIVRTLSTGELNGL
jgi:hypothetical protein